MTVVPIERDGADLARHGVPSYASARPSLDEQWRFAEALAGAGLLPEAYRQNPANVLLAMQKAEQHNIHLMTAMEGFSPIKGKLFMEATTMRALILAAGHRFDVVELTRERCVIVSQRRGETTEFRDEYDIEDARLGGLFTNDNYRKHPKRMLLARCTSQAGNAHFSDVLKGTAYTPEDFGLTGDELSEASVTQAVAPAPAAAALMAPTPTVDNDDADTLAEKLASRIAAAASADDLRSIAADILTAERSGTLDREQVVQLREAATARAGELPAGRKALTRMHAALTALGLDSDQRKQAAGNIVGRVITSTSELTGAEADTVWRRAAAAARLDEVFTRIGADDQDDRMFVVSAVTGRSDLVSSMELTEDETSRVIGRLEGVVREGQPFADFLAELVLELATGPDASAEPSGPVS